MDWVWLKTVVEANVGDLLLAVLFLGFMMKFSNRQTSTGNNSSTNATNTTNVGEGPSAAVELQNRDWMERHFMAIEGSLRDVRDDTRVLRDIRDDGRAHAARMEGLMKALIRQGVDESQTLTPRPERPASDSLESILEARR